MKRPRRPEHIFQEVASIRYQLQRVVSLGSQCRGNQRWSKPLKDHTSRTYPIVLEERFNEGRRLLLTPYYFKLLLPTYYLLRTTYDLLLTTYYLILTTYYFTIYDDYSYLLLAWWLNYTIVWAAGAIAALESSS